MEPAEQGRDGDGLYRENTGASRSRGDRARLVSDNDMQIMLDLRNAGIMVEDVHGHTKNQR